MSDFKEISSSQCYGGTVKKYQHTSHVLLGSVMKFVVFTPPGATVEKPAAGVWFLSGLTCNEDNFITKAGACRKASELGIALICPDTSPRGIKVEGDDASWDFGVSAGFYVDATDPKWAAYQMYSYITKELTDLIDANIKNVDVAERTAVMGHSMGGHGALITALKNPGRFKCAAAFSPIVTPTDVPWGQKAFTGYLGSIEAGRAYDAAELLGKYPAEGPKLPLKVVQGTADSFYPSQLQPEVFEAKLKVAKNENLSVEITMAEGYDHSYWFIQTYIDEVLLWINKYL
ncbi:esterase [Gonapodya prolifera JEL478]|uniref:S-formylglutathione hydrolase n=1 Tax=Gonapodya prolifera (strain JEL478) TaxID=1344416 RepID=A0A139AZZ0_GONPJ|nr:esterase [Gonapodya prolifera JEL478]|eukprot:KXS22277.1 esterase [Gonapodya prolifera JEL478]